MRYTWLALLTNTEKHKMCTFIIQHCSRPSDFKCLVPGPAAPASNHEGDHHPTANPRRSTLQQNKNNNTSSCQQYALAKAGTNNIQTNTEIHGIFFYGPTVGRKASA